MEDIAEIILFYGTEKVKEVLTTTLHLDEDILYLASAILDTPFKEFFMLFYQAVPENLLKIGRIS